MDLLKIHGFCLAGRNASVNHLKMSKNPIAELDRLRMIYSLGDFQLALSALTFLCEVDPDSKYSKENIRRYKCFETAMVVAYSRPFSSSHGEVPRLTLDMIGVELSDEQKDLHKLVVGLRNQSFAHSDAAKMRMVVKSFEVGLGEKNPMTMFLPAFDEGLQFAGSSDLNPLNDLINLLYSSLYELLLIDAQENSTAYDFERDYLFD